MNVAEEKAKRALRINDLVAKVQTTQEIAEYHRRQLETMRAEFSAACVATSEAENAFNVARDALIKELLAGVGIK